MIFITGDIHGDISRFKQTKKAKIKKKDVLFVCGDFGFVWDGDKKEEKAVKWIGKRRYITIFVDGYNENHKRLNEFPDSEVFGGKVKQLSGNLYYAHRGEIFDIDGVKAFAFGGGSGLSGDEPKESDTACMPSVYEMQNASDRLNEVGNEVDLIITHEAPARLKAFIDMESNELDHLHTFLEDICETVKFKQWYFGKYHENKRIPPCYNLIFTQIKRYGDD